jgi:hypothetical protein
VRALITRARGLVVAIAALALSAGLAFGAEPPEAASWGLSNAAAHAGKTVPVQAGQDETIDEDEEEEVEEPEEEVDEEVDEAGDEAGDNCTTDPTALTDEEIAELKRGSLVCWAAHQKTWDEAEFKNHGAWVKSWAHWGKDAEDEGEDGDDPAGDDDDDDDDDDADGAASSKSSKGSSKGKGPKNRD